MAMKHLVSINLNQNELQNARIHNLATAPASPVSGQIYFNTADKALYMWDGTAWRNLNEDKVYTFTSGLTDDNGTVTLDKATTSTIGGVIVPTSGNLSVDANGNISVPAATDSVKGVVSVGSNINVSNGEISVNTATDAQLGLVQAGTNIDIASGVISVKDASTTDKGVAKLASTEEITAGTSTTAVITVKNLKDALDGVDGDLETKVDIAQGAANASKFVKTDENGDINTFSTISSSDLTDNDDLLKKVEGSTLEAGTYTKVTVTDDGIVTAGATLAASDIPDLSATYVNVNQKGAANGVAPLDSNQLVPSEYLPSYVDDVIELSTIAATAPATATAGDRYYNSGDKKIYVYEDGAWTEESDEPQSGKIYVTADTNKSYRWSGSDLAEISAATIHKYTSDITGDGTTTSFAVAHSLGTQSVLVQVYDASWNLVVVDITNTSASTTTVSFDTAPTASETYHVVIIA